MRPNAAPPIAQQLPSESQASTIRAPYQIHHGENDDVVPLLVDQLLSSFLSSRGVTQELVVHRAAGHNDIAVAQNVLDRVRAWYRAHGVL
jgi:predicted esterase